jgi:glycolate oxidase iron-sulfur subunit
MAWVTDHPPEEANLDSCVTCGLCLPVCPTFRLTGDESASPRGRLTAIAAVSDGLGIVDERFDEITSYCLQCRACETACPSMVPFGEIIEAARYEAVTQVPAPDRSIKRAVLGRALAMPWLLRFASVFAAVLQRLGMLRFLPIVGAQTTGLRRIPLPLRSTRGGAWGDDHAPSATLFVGCVADPWFTDIHRASVELLVASGYHVEATPAQTCCGALAAHAGLGSDAKRLAKRNIDALERSDLVVVDVAGCGAHLKGYRRYDERGERLAAKTKDITEVIASAIGDGRLPLLSPSREKVAIVDPCHLEHAQGITSEPRTLLAAAGFDIIDADPGGLCCGAAGAYQLDHPETGAVLGEAKAEKVVDTGASLVASANAGCEMQLRRFLGAGYEIAHPVELYWRRWRRGIQGNTHRHQ